MIRAVLFDVGGTLHVVQRDPELAQKFARTLLDRLEAAGIVLPTQPAPLAALLERNAEAYKRRSEETRRELPNDQIWAEYYLKDFGLTRGQLRPMAEELSVLYDTVRVRNVPRLHMKGTIRELQTMGLRLGVISNMISHTFVPRLLQEYCIADAMECVVLSADVGVRKPDPAIFRIAAERMGIAPEETAYVGDTLSRDVLGCRNAGIGLSIQICNPSMAHRDAELADTGLHPDALIRDLAEIPGVIRSDFKK